LSGDGVEIDAARRSDLGAIAPVLAEAFLDDPAWVASGPRHRRHRALANRASFWGILQASHRHGARIRFARPRGARRPVLGATIAFEPGRWPLPDRVAIWELGWALVAGPGPLRRGLRDDRAMRAGHVEHPHLYLWFIGVDPGSQGSGVGRALMAELHADSDRLGLPTYLETGTEANVGFYRALGYEARGEVELPSGPRMWKLERPAGAGLRPSS
jgi:ribosomal protein S18 acetylase RimI-like enzyme